MKTNALALSGIEYGMWAAAVLFFALGLVPPSTPETASAPVLPSDDGEATDSGPVPLPVVVSEDPEPEEDPEPPELLQVWYYWSRNCIHCPAMSRMMDRLEIDGVEVHRVDCTGRNYEDIRAVPTVRLYDSDATLIDTIEGVADESYLRRQIGITDDTIHNEGGAAAVPTANNVAICCCQDRYASRCLCLKEIAAGIRRGPCGCSSTHGTRHYVDSAGNPTGPVPDNGREHLVRLRPETIRMGAGVPYCPQ